MGLVFKTKLIGQKYIEEIFTKILNEDDIPHIFISGINGSGKTTLLKEFIKVYYSKFNIKNTNEWIMNLSSEKDRGSIKSSGSLSFFQTCTSCNFVDQISFVHSN